MSELLLHWLNDDLQLSTFITNVEDDFASGYLLGEILQRFNQQHNFSDFMNRTTADAKIINFCLLEPTLRRLHVRFDSEIAAAIMNGRSGATANLLYQIKMAAERVARGASVSTRSEERRNVRPLHNVPPKLSKPSYDAAHHYFFEHSVRRQVKSLNGLQHERDAMDAEKQRMRAYHQQQTTVQHELEHTKAERLHRAFLHSQYIKTALDETDSPAWRLALEKKRERERRKALFYQQLLADKTRRHDRQTYSLRQTVEHDLDEFERTTKSLGKTNGHAKTPSLLKSLGYGLRSLTTTLAQQAATNGPGFRDPSKPTSVGEATSEQLQNTTTIREQKQHRVRRRDQLVRRRKRFLQDAYHAQCYANTSRLVSGLETLVGRATHCERESTEAMAKIVVYKEIATENRRRREERYADRREMDAHEAIDRDTAVWEVLFAKYNDDWEIQALQKNQRIAACAAAQQHENQLVAGCVLHEILEFAMVVAGKREDSMHTRDPMSFLPTEESWSELRFQFAAGGVHALDHVDDELLQAQLAEYLHRFLTPEFVGHDSLAGVTIEASTNSHSPWAPSDWKFGAAIEIVENRFVLGETVKYLRWLAHADPPSPDIIQPNPPTEMERVPAREEEETKEPGDVEKASGEAVIRALQEPDAAVAVESSPLSEAVVPNPDPNPEAVKALPRLCILLAGPPFAGKTTQAKLLADKYDLALLSVEQQLAKTLINLSELGREAQTYLLHGDQLPPRIYSCLVVDAIQQLDPPYQHRWVLYDLPSTQAHSQSLEEALTGFVEPSAIPSPFDYASRLAPCRAKPPLPPSFLHHKSGLDLVFYLDCAEASVLERCLGLLEDRATHAQTCHLLFAPPPFDATDRHRLQHVNHTSNASAVLSLHCLSTQDVGDDAKKWFTRFDTLRDIATTEGEQGQRVASTRALTVEATHTRLVAHVEAYFARRLAMNAAREQEKERNEAIAMQHEEDRHRKIVAWKQRILQTQEDVQKAMQAVQHAEDAKAKKDEIAELRNATEVAKKHVEDALMDAQDWLMDEARGVRQVRSIYSARLVPTLAKVLASLWDGMEQEYTEVMKQCLQMQQQQRQRVEQRARWVVSSICKFMRRTDAKQPIVDTFQSQFNAVVEDMRFDDATKRELHARTDVLQDALQTTTRTKQQESDDELKEMLGDGWVDATSQWIALIYQRMLQAECDRFRVSLQLLVDAFVAASDEPMQLTSVVDALKSHPQLLAELTLKAFVDVSDEQAAAAVVAAPVATSAAATGKAGAKATVTAAAKKKPSIAPQAPIQVTGATAESGEVVDPLATETLLLAYDLVLHKCESLVQLIVEAKPAEQIAAAAVPPPSQSAATAHGKPSGKTGATPTATPTATPVSSMALLPRQSIDVATSNFQKALHYEHDQLVQRVHFLKEAVQNACDHVTRVMRSVEATLRNAIEQRAWREDAAAAALVAYVRTAIEAETNLPFYLHIQPEQGDRFPITQHVVEDTRVIVDTKQRLVPRAPVDPPPEIEENDALRVNTRQARELRRRLLVVEDKEEEEEISLSMTIVEVVSVLSTLATEPHALPTLWQHADESTLVQLLAAFADTSGLVDTRALVQAMETGTPALLDRPQQPQTKQPVEEKAEEEKTVEA